MSVPHFVKICQVLTILHQLICRGVTNFGTWCSCQKWVHKKCSDINGSMYTVMKSFICRGCMNLITGTGHISVDIGVNANLVSVDKFFLLR